MQITVTIPDEFAGQIVPAGTDAARLLMEEAVAGAYRERRLSVEQVRQVLGLETLMEVDRFLLEHEIYDYTVEDLDSDLATLKRLSVSRLEQSNL